MSGSSTVTVKQIQAAVFGKETDKIFLAKAVSDIVSNDVTMRVDVVKTMADSCCQACLWFPDDRD